MGLSNGESRAITGLGSGQHLLRGRIDHDRVGLAADFVGDTADCLAAGDGVAERAKLINDRLRHRGRNGNGLVGFNVNSRGSDRGDRRGLEIDEAATAALSR